MDDPVSRPPAANTSSGTPSARFAHPDGHPWDPAYNPFWDLDGAGRVVLPG